MKNISIFKHIYIYLDIIKWPYILQKRLFTNYYKIFENGQDPTEYINLEESSLLQTINSNNSTNSNNKKVLFIPNTILSNVVEKGILYIQYFYRKNHLESLKNIYFDPKSTKNEKFIAFELLKNACVSSSRIIPSCQDTGTACIFAKRGKDILTEGNDEIIFSKAIYNTYRNNNLRYSILSATGMFDEVNTKCNLPAQLDIITDFDQPNQYDILLIAKGGGSSSRTFLFQENKSLFTDENFRCFFRTNLPKLGTSGCPPYHLSIVVGGLSPEQCLKTVKLAATHYYDELPTHGSEYGKAFRDIYWETEIKKICEDIGIGAQFGGKHFAHDVRVIRLPRHGAHTPIGIGVSCSADRQLKIKINTNGVFMERLVEDPHTFLPEYDLDESKCENINLDDKFDLIIEKLSSMKIGTRVNITGKIIIARDLAHARILQILNQTGKIPDYMNKFKVIYYAGPSKKPENMVSGSLGPTTASRMDIYLEPFMKNNASIITMAKGNRSHLAVEACKKYNGFYLGVPGGPAALHATERIKSLNLLDFDEFGMEAVWLADVVNFPAFIVIDNKGNDLYSQWIK